MKIKNLLLVGCIGLASLNAYCGQDRGGGDLCENRIKNIRNDIEKWIYDGGGKKLKNFPVEMTLDNYETEMLQAIKQATIKCVGPGDIGYPVVINNVPKTCVYDKTMGAGEITCDSEKFQKISESDQYVLIHHEYAGFAGIEKPTGADSQYDISNQISGFLEDQIVKKLTINPKKAISAVVPAPVKLYVNLLFDKQNAADYVVVDSEDPYGKTSVSYQYWTEAKEGSKIKDITLTKRQLAGLDPLILKPGTYFFAVINLRMAQRKRHVRLDFSLNNGQKTWVNVGTYDFSGQKGFAFNVHDFPMADN